MEEQTPTVQCYERNNQLFFSCEECGKRHYHGTGEGHRISHCDVEGAYPNGYYLKLSALEQLKSYSATSSGHPET